MEQELVSLDIAHMVGFIRLSHKSYEETGYKLAWWIVRLVQKLYRERSCDTLQFSTLRESVQLNTCQLLSPSSYAVLKNLMIT